MDVPDNALRMWLLLRAFIYEKDPASRSVRITDEELAKLMHRSVSAVRKIRKTAYECGLLAEESCVQESYRAPNGRHQLRTVRRITVLHIDPPEGYSGPTNIYSELRRIRGISAAQTGRSKSDTQSHQGKSSKAPASPNGEQHSDQHKQNVSAGRTECHFLVEGRQNFDDPCQKIARSTPAEQGKPSPQVSLTSASNNQPSRAREDSDGGDEGSWLVGDPSGEQPPKTKEGALGTPGARLLAGLKAADGSRVAAHGVRAHAPTIDAALEVMSEHEIVEHLTGGGIRTAGGIVSRISSLADRVEIMARQRAEAAAIRDCGLCDGGGFRYHPEGRHHGPTSERCDHQPVDPDAPSAQVLPEAEESTSGAARENATETLTVDQARLMIRQILARSKGKSATRAPEAAVEPSSSPSEGDWTQAVTRAL